MSFFRRRRRAATAAAAPVTVAPTAVPEAATPPVAVRTAPRPAATGRPTRDALRDPRLEAQLRDVGYVKVRLLDPDTLAATAAELDQLRPDDGFAPDGTGLNRSTYHCTFLDTNLEYKERAQELIRRVYQPLIDEYVIDYRILTGNFYVKMPGTGRFQIHQNWPTTEDLALTTLTVWAPFHDTDYTNGTLCVVPGSHKIVPDVASPQRPPFFASFEDELIDHHLVPMELEAGEALIFDDSLLHWSPENRSDAPRRAVQIETVPAEAPTVLYHLGEHDGAERWDLYEVDDRFFIDHSIDQVIGRPTDLELLTVADYVNRELDEPQFVELLERGPSIRSQVYAGKGWPAPR